LSCLDGDSLAAYNCNENAFADAECISAIWVMRFVRPGGIRWKLTVLATVMSFQMTAARVSFFASCPIAILCLPCHCSSGTHRLMVGNPRRS
ncbi:MAG: hypothetical protein ACXVAR_16670, partial [Vulcanimicrobiaceae bacterium]